MRLAKEKLDAHGFCNKAQLLRAITESRWMLTHKTHH